MTDDPKIAAMLAATDFVVRFAPYEGVVPSFEDLERAEDLMRAVADRWLSWYQQHEVMKVGTPNPPILYTPGEPPRQLCGAYVEPDWYSALPAGARSAYPWLTCSGEHDDRGWHLTGPLHENATVTFGTHHFVSAWNAWRVSGDRGDYLTGRCSCGEAWSADHPTPEQRAQL